MNYSANRLAIAVICYPLVLCAAGSLVGCNDTPVASHWTADSIRVDGLSRDWDKLPRAVSKNPRISFGVSNDAHHLYLLLHANDPELVSKLTAQGITLWFDANGTKRKTFGLLCRGNRMPGRPMERGPRGDAPPALAKLTVLNGSPHNRIPLTAKSERGPQVESRTEGGGFTYEVSLPLTKADGDYALGAAPGNVISLGIELGHERPNRKPAGDGPPDGGRGGGPGGGRGGGPGGMGGGPGGGMGGGPGGRGGGPGGGMGGGPPPDEQIRSKREVWFNVLLARGDSLVP